MTSGLAAMLAGAFGVPVVLLWAGHRLRRRSRRWHRSFWGALMGHVAAAPLAITASMTPAAEWAAGDTLRGFVGFWLLLLAPILGAIIGSFVGARSPRP